MTCPPKSILPSIIVSFLIWGRLKHEKIETLEEWKESSRKSLDMVAHACNPNTVEG